MLTSEYEEIDIIRDHINPKHIILMHIQQDQNKKIIDATEQVKERFPSVMIFEKKMKTKKYNFE